jgi:ATP-dependent Clp protease ATP-binding subunit ClpX
MPFFQCPYCNPKEIKRELDQYVLEQDKGTRTIASAIAQHLIQTERFDDANTSSALVVGPSGSGKTETYRSLCRLESKMQVPVIMVNALDYSGTKSWQGTSITKIFEDVLLRAGDLYYADHDGSEPVETQRLKIVRLANRAIIIIDEIDKIAIQGDGRARNFLMEYQSNLLKIVEGNTYELDGFTHEKGINEKGEKETIDICDVTVDTTHMMFILMGAFSGLEQITLQRLEQERQRKELRQTPRHVLYQDTSLGFLIEPRRHDDKPREIKYTYEQMIPSTDDIVRYGFLRELVGRLSIRTVYKPLSQDALVHIMLKAKTSAYREYQHRFEQIGAEMRCDRAGLREIARIAVERGTGARGLSTVFSELLSDTWYDLAGDNRHIRILLRGRDIKAGKPPLLHDRTELVHRKWLLRRKTFLKKVQQKKAGSTTDSAS